ncbi:hypothetical protein GCM10023231_18660 [Olivibacter ginsenosidimutans]|uniref:Alpha-L-rhamnosidase six-hairpin glycosidase domain-containing protein n=1 Tax=Olivibacter ginsenosidimutans TaxID=1176537 RepID=A0ABP9B696_9SPHI
MSATVNVIIFSFLLFYTNFCRAQQSPYVKHDRATKIVHMTVPDQQLSLDIDYAQGCVLKQVYIKGKPVLSNAGAYTGVTTANGDSFSSHDASPVQLSERENSLILRGIVYGNDDINVNEEWHFIVQNGAIRWDIIRTYQNEATLEETAFPTWNFTDLSIWKGGIMDNGGMVWCKYLNQVNDTYGVHTGGVTFWNPDTGDGFKIDANASDGKAVAAAYSHNTQGAFTCTQSVTDQPLQQRYHLSRFVSQKSNVFAPFPVSKGTVKLSLNLSYVDYDEVYSRGKLAGIDAVAVRELMNTTARYGVVDNAIVGANGWLTNWKCLHEPFFAQIALALNDDNYTKNLAATLDQERDEAVSTDGRVLSRWHDVPGDEIPGTYNTKTGYYEAKWGYTIDSQTGYIINTSELFALNGDRDWLRSHQASCEKALDWLIKRDSDHNGIFEMMNNTIAEEKASDWLDIVWASYENAFVNAQLYEALTLWSTCEQVLNNPQKATYYATVAARLKEAFNKPVEKGGFWSETKQQYVYWRDKDGSIHGDNLVTPVNFAAIAFGICDDPKRIALILDQVEKRTQAERLFHWPLCFDSFQRAEVSGGNWPFPMYENGDIFPTWGYLGIRAYAAYDKTIALNYIHKLLAQYNKDGLSSQRYNRVSQKGEGSDILSGICTTITGLYRDIYGVRPSWDRLGIEPHLTPELDGTTFNYKLRGTTYQLTLHTNSYSVKGDGFAVKSQEHFGIAKTKEGIVFYPQNQTERRLTVREKTGKTVDLVVAPWKEEAISWEALAPGNYQFTWNDLPKGARYQLWINGKRINTVTVDEGVLTLTHQVKRATKFLLKPIA